MSNLDSIHNRVVWFDLPCVDLKRAAAFYTAVLAIKIEIAKHEEFEFGVFEHDDCGNGGCLVPNAKEVTSDKGALMYFSVNGRLKEAVEAVKENGGSILQDIHPLGPYGSRAVVIDSEGNRVALHSK